LKSLLSEACKNWLAIVLVALTLVTGIIGFILTDPEAFLGNTLAEATGLFVGILVTLLIVDKYLERQREKQWLRVREVTYEAIVTHLRDLLSNVVFYLSEDVDLLIPLARDGEQSSKVIAVIEVLKSQLEFFGGDKPTFSEAFYDAVKWDLDHIRDVLTPRVIQSSNDQHVIDALVEFDQASSEVHNVVVKQKKVSREDVYPSIVKFLERVQALYSVVSENLHHAS
jgi:hypothetical protein